MDPISFESFDKAEEALSELAGFYRHIGDTAHYEQCLSLLKELRTAYYKQCGID